MNFQVQKHLLSNTLVLLFASLIACLAVPIYMIAQSPDDFDFIVISTFLTSGFLLAALLFIALSLVMIMLHLFLSHRSAGHFSLFVSSWIVLAGFILPLAVSTGMVEPAKNPIDKLHLVIVLILALSLTVFASKASRKATLWFLTIIVAGSLIPSLYTVYTQLDGAGTSEQNTAATIFKDELSSKRNILVVSFDGVPGGVIAGLLKNEPEFSEVFKDFVVFENAVSQSPVTILSLLGEVYGVRDYKSLGNDFASVFKSLRKKGLNEHLLSRKVEDSFKYGYGFTNMKKLPLNPVGTIYQKQLETIAFFRYPFVRMGTSFTLSLFPWGHVTTLLRTSIDYTDLDLSLNNFDQHKGGNWDIKNIIKILDYKNWVEGLSVADKEFSVRYLHFTFTHFPVDFDANCNYRSDDLAWYQSSQNEDGIRSQTVCALSLLSDFIHKLKKLGVYENSMLVFKSDHGEPPYYYSDEPDNLQINGHKNFGYNRYRPTLMIKNFDTNDDSITFNNDLVLLNDLAKTLCINSGLELRCELFPGLDLMGSVVRSNDPYFIYVVKDASSTYKFETYNSVKIPSRNIDFLDALKASPQVILSPVVDD